MIDCKNRSRVPQMYKIRSFFFQCGVKDSNSMGEDLRLSALLQTLKKMPGPLHIAKAALKETGKIETQRRQRGLTYI